MNQSSLFPRTASFVELLAARIGADLTDQERAAISQLAHDYVDMGPQYVEPRLSAVTILMADLRGFSALAASSEPESLVSTLQPFFATMTSVIHKHGGFVDKFMGDGIMALFGAPNACEDHQHRALSCAAEMQCAMEELNTQLNSQHPPLYIGIGLNSGDVMAGSFGSRKYSEYTVIGDAVNVAARMEKFALRGEVLLSKPCYDAAKTHVEVSASRELRVRGQNKPITFHSLKAITSPQRIEVPNVEMRTSPRVPVDLPLHYHTVENQRVLPQKYEGHIVNLGYGGMLAQIPQPLPELGEITFGISDVPTATKHEDVYARALHQREIEDGYQTAFAFTSVGSRGQEAVRRCVDEILAGA